MPRVFKYTYDIYFDAFGNMFALVLIQLECVTDVLVGYQHSHFVTRKVVVYARTLSYTALKELLHALSSPNLICVICYNIICYIFKNTPPT
jgi:hypothetical protein